ncbi:MAG: hypothetical protein JXQ91_17595 [Vannielia sp.]|uniref:DUF6455 family protein n=1 Tax=Vannielia sp. TaxID=2813045 RepID=UPI003B8B3C6D
MTRPSHPAARPGAASQAVRLRAPQPDAWASVDHCCPVCGWSDTCTDWPQAHAEPSENCPPACRSRRQFAALRMRSEHARQLSRVASETAVHAQARSEAIHRRVSARRY